MKGKLVRITASKEDQVGSSVMGQIGAQLFAESNFSLLKPNLLGIICNGTMVRLFYDLKSLLMLIVID